MKPVPYPALLSHILDGGHYRPLLSSPEVEQHRTAWRGLFKTLKSRPPEDATMAECFHTQWHVSHHLIRELVADDELLMDALWVWLPRYEGPSLVLYRGENIDRYEAGRIGTAWTEISKKAHQFATGLNAVGKGGVLLRTAAPLSSIIASPSKHSLYLGEAEFSLDTRRLDEIKIISQHPPHS